MSKRPSNRFIAPADLTPENLLAVFKGAGMEAELDDGDVKVTSDRRVAVAQEMEKMKVMALGPYSARVTTRDCSVAKDQGATHIVFVHHPPRPAWDQARVNAWCNWVNSSQRYVKASSYEESVKVDWWIPVLGVGISAGTLVSSLALYFYTLGSIYSGEFD